MVTKNTWHKSLWHSGNGLAGCQVSKGVGKDSRHQFLFCSHSFPLGFASSSIPRVLLELPINSPGITLMPHRDRQVTQATHKTIPFCWNEQRVHTLRHMTQWSPLEGFLSVPHFGIEYSCQENC